MERIERSPAALDLRGVNRQRLTVERFRQDPRPCWTCGPRWICGRGSDWTGSVAGPFGAFLIGPPAGTLGRFLCVYMPGPGNIGPRPRWIPGRVGPAGVNRQRLTVERFRQDPRPCWTCGRRLDRTVPVVSFNEVPRWTVSRGTDRTVPGRVADGPAGVARIGRSRLPVSTRCPRWYPPTPKIRTRYDRRTGGLHIPGAPDYRPLPSSATFLEKSGTMAMCSGEPIAIDCPPLGDRFPLFFVFQPLGLR